MEFWKTRLEYELQKHVKKTVAVKTHIKKVLDYIEESERETESKQNKLTAEDCELQDFTDNLGFKKLDQELIEKGSIITKQIRSLDQLNQELRTTQDDLNNVRQKLQQDSKVLNETKQNLAKKEQEVKELGSKVEQKDKLIAERDTQIQTIENDMKVLKFELDWLKKICETNNRDLTGELKDVLADLREQAAKIAEELKEKQNSVVERKPDDEKQQDGLGTENTDLNGNELDSTANGKLLAEKGELIKTLEFELKLKTRELEYVNELKNRERKHLELSDELKSILDGLRQDAARIAEELMAKPNASSKGSADKSDQNDTVELEQLEVSNLQELGVEQPDSTVEEKTKLILEKVEEKLETLITASEHSKSELEEWIVKMGGSTKYYQEELEKKDEKIKALETQVKEQELKLEELQVKASHDAKHIHELQVNLKNIEVEMLTSRQLVKEAKIRELKHQKFSDELKDMISGLRKETAMIAKELKEKQSSSSSCSDDEAVTTDSVKTPDHLCRLKSIRSHLIEKINAKIAAAWMYERSALNLPEFESIQLCKRLCEAAERLLDAIMDEPTESIYNCFLNALKATNQQHIYSWISYPDYKIDSTHVELMRKNYSYLVECIDSVTSDLLNQLFTKQVVELREMEHLQAEQNSFRRNEKLISILGRKSAELFACFLSALAAVNQDYVIDVLNGKNKVDNPGRRNSHSSDDSGGVELPEPVDELDVEEMPEEPVDENDVEEMPEGPVDEPDVEEMPEGPVGVRVESSLKGTIASKKGRVSGVTMLDDKLFVLREPSNQIITQYDIETLDKVLQVSIPGLSDMMCMLASCPKKRCLYLCDKNQRVFKAFIAPFSKRNWEVKRWRMDIVPHSLSVTGAATVLVANSQLMSEYTTDGALLRSIAVATDYTSLNNKTLEAGHAVKMTDDKFIISHYKPFRGLTICDSKPTLRVVSSHIIENESDVRNFNKPMYFSITSNKSVILAESDKNRIITMDSSLKVLHNLKLPAQLYKPCCFYYDEPRGRLYVGENDPSERRVLVFDNVRFTS